MVNIFLFLGIVFLLTFLIGKLVEKIRVPWIFSALLIGSLLAIWNPFSSITSSETFNFLANLGMYLLLFIIGFEIDLKKLKKAKGFILKSTFFIIFLEAIFGSILIYFLFEYSLLISFIVALSFATVGEAILIPILDEFKITNTKLGQSIIGIGTLDDVIEILVLIFVVFLIGENSTTSHISVIAILFSIGILFGLTYTLTRLKENGMKFKFLSIENLFVFVLFVLFLFLGIGDFAHAAPIAALLAGISLRTFVPDKRLKKIKSEIRTVCYGFFAPIFFLWIGLEMNIDYLIAFPLVVILMVVVSKSAKIFGSYVMGRKELGVRQSILMGIGLSVRFSTSIIIIKILFDNGLIGSDLYSIIIASSIIFKFLVPFLFSNLLVRWGIGKKRKENG